MQRNRNTPQKRENIVVRTTMIQSLVKEYKNRWFSLWLVNSFLYLKYSLSFHGCKTWAVLVPQYSSKRLNVGRLKYFLHEAINYIAFSVIELLCCQT